MQYNKEINNVSLLRDVYADHFAGPSDIKTNYMVEVFGDIIDEDEDAKALAKRLKKISQRLLAISKFLEKK
jgi:hypothetical protein